MAYQAEHEWRWVSSKVLDGPSREWRMGGQLEVCALCIDELQSVGVIDLIVRTLGVNAQTLKQISAV